MMNLFLTMNKNLLIAIAVVLQLSPALAEHHANQYHIDPSVVLKKGINKPCGAVSAWLRDSADRRDLKPQLKELGLGALRFPGGHVSDLYLWHDIDAGSPHDGLKQKVATPHCFLANTNRWGWGINPDLSMKGDTMDFDEFMETCQAIGAEPLVVVNVLSYKYKKGPTLDKLVKTAAQWVKYAKEKGYKVGYWQIGNEIDHHRDIISRDEYLEVYQRFVRAMKAEDPTIKTSFGIIGRADYYREFLKASKDEGLVDFLSAHQYLHNISDKMTTYEDWSNFNGRLAYNIPTVVRFSKQYGNLPILITETNAWGKRELLEGRATNDWGKSLCWFDLLMELVVAPNVQCAYYWSTTNLWNRGKNGPSELCFALIDDEGAFTNRAYVSKLVNDFAVGDLIKTNSQNKKQPVFAFHNKNKNEINLLISNKKGTSVPMEYFVKGVAEGATFNLKTLSAKSPGDFDHTKTKHKLKTDNGSLSVQLPPFSINAININLENK